MVSIAGNEIVCENGILHLECMDNEVINLSEANYGRTIKGGVCHCKEGTSIDANLARKFINHTHKYVNEYISTPVKLKDTGIGCVLR